MSSYFQTYKRHPHLMIEIARKTKVFEKDVGGKIVAMKRGGVLL